jgi:hypothetical protein
MKIVGDTLSILSKHLGKSFALYWPRKYVWGKEYWSSALQPVQIQSDFEICKKIVME